MTKKVFSSFSEESQEEFERIIYHLKVGEFINFFGGDILKVPNGWIYRFYDSNGYELAQAVFVPEKK